MHLSVLVCIRGKYSRLAMRVVLVIKIGVAINDGQSRNDVMMMKLQWKTEGVIEILKGKNALL